MTSLPSSSSSRLVWPGLSGFYANMVEVSYLLLRVAAGLILMPHGAQKLFAWWGGPGMTGTTTFFGRVGLNPAEPLAWLAACIEFFGGILIAVGLFTRPIAAAIAIEMAVIVLVVHWPRGFFSAQGGIEYPLLWGFVFLFIAFIGGGKWSLDKAIGKEV
jgi:putative oxidoreductase